MDRKLKIAVIFGGCSPEYPVSLESAHSVITSLDRSKYELILLGITKGGEWFRFLRRRRLTGGRHLAQRPLEMRPRRYFARTGTCTASLNSA